MQRYFIETVGVVNQFVSLNQEITHHAFEVMRGKVGDNILIVDSTHQLFLATLGNKSNQTSEAMLTEALISEVEFPVQVAIACGLSKNDKLEWIVQKATEGGMTNFYPLALKRDVMKWNQDKAPKKIERLSKIALEASEQSHRVKIPEIHSLFSLIDLINATQDYTIKLIAYEETAKVGAHKLLKESLQQIKPDDKILMVFGSEGGLDSEEIRQLEQSGFKACSLGPRILRAETAPIYFLSALSYQIEL